MALVSDKNSILDTLKRNYPEDTLTVEIDDKAVVRISADKELFFMDFAFNRDAAEGFAELFKYLGWDAIRIEDAA